MRLRIRVFNLLLAEKKCTSHPANTHLQVFLATEGACDMTVPQGKFLTASYAFPVRKGFPYLKMFNTR